MKNKQKDEHFLIYERDLM